jgi:uncharacterized BrkB/YihY/UPF0761 family membrane protein
MNSLISVFFVMGVISLIALWIYALVSAIKNERLDSNMRLIWVLVIILVNGLGALLYLLIAPNRPSAGEQMLDEWNRRNRMRQ